MPTLRQADTPRPRPPSDRVTLAGRSVLDGGGRPLVVTFSPSSRGRLTNSDLDRFPSETLFDRLARAVCHAGCLPRKELYEAWEVGRRVRRRLRGGRVVDFGGGHGLLAQVLLLLDDSSPSAIVVDKALPLSSAAVHDALRRTWPRLAGRVGFVALPMDHVPVETDDVVVSSHACGLLTDRVPGPRHRCSSARGGPAVLSQSRERHYRRCRRLARHRSRHRRDAGPSSGGERLSDLDTDHTSRHHSEEPAVDGRATVGAARRAALSSFASEASGCWP